MHFITLFTEFNIMKENRRKNCHFLFYIRINYFQKFYYRLDKCRITLRNKYDRNL